MSCISIESAKLYRNTEGFSFEFWWKRFYTHTYMQKDQKQLKNLICIRTGANFLPCNPEYKWEEKNPTTYACLRGTPIISFATHTKIATTRTLKKARKINRDICPFKKAARLIFGRFLWYWWWWLSNLQKGPHFQRLLHLYKHCQNWHPPVVKSDL